MHAAMQVLVLQRIGSGQRYHHTITDACNTETKETTWQPNHQAGEEEYPSDAENHSVDRKAPTPSQLPTQPCSSTVWFNNPN
jgi:hypothetical protein